MRKRLLAEAVAENLDTMRGRLPRPLRPKHRHLAKWLRWSPVLLVALTLTASTYFIEPKTEAVVIAHPSPVLRAAQPAPPPAPAPVADDTQPPQRVAAAAFPLAVRRVVLDFGHGGIDPGASGLGLNEKDVTLDIGQRLARLLKASGFQVIETRSDDRTIKLRERALVANQSHSDVFVSIHVNSLASHTYAHGVETYYLGPTSDPKLTKLAAEENSMSGYSMADLRKLLDSVYADVRRDESLQLAKKIQQNLFSGLRAADPGLENWGVKRAPFVVLVATDMPAILAEVGCISNSNEAAMLGEPEYRQKIAEALFHGIDAYAGAADTPQKKGS